MPPPALPSSWRRSAFTTALNHILLVAAIIAFVAGALSRHLVRTRDFAPDEPHGAA